MRVLMLALGASRRASVYSDSEFLLEHGADVVLVTPWAKWYPELDSRVEVLEVGPAERRHPILLAERAIGFRAPKALFELSRGMLHGVVRAAGGSRPRKSVLRRLKRAERNVRTWTSRYHQSVFSRFYRKIQPTVYWRAAQRVLPPDLVDSADLVLIMDPQAIPLAWHEARQHPDTTFSFTLDRAGVAQPAELVSA